MTRTMNESAVDSGLRRRAVSRLTGQDDLPSARADASAALSVLHDLASSPETASSALALLHELQVHQVELDLQDEELRRSRIELEATAIRMTQLYEHAPAAYFTLDGSTVVREVNPAGARLLGLERELLLGRTLAGLLAPESARTLQAMLARIAQDSRTESGELSIPSPDGGARRVRIVGCPDPAADRFLVILDESGKSTAS